MHSRRDQLEAHTFVKGRDAARPPLRRTPIALMLGAVVGAFALAGVAVFALIKPAPSASAWQHPGALIVEKETGNRYVLSQGRLRPVLNYASARLLLGNQMTVVPAAARSLAELPRGGAVGILGAPDTLPATASAGAEPWLVCATQVQAAGGGSQPGVTVLVGAAVPPPSLLTAAAALVRTPDGTLYLAANGMRMRLTAPWAARALGLNEDQAFQVRSAWVGALPAGPDLGAMPIEGRGGAGPTLDGRPTRVGQVLVVSSPGLPDRRYVVTSSGLIAVNATAAALLLGDPATGAAYGGGGARMLPLSPTGLASAPILATPAWAGLPPMPAALAPAGSGGIVCALEETVDRTERAVVVSAPAATVSGAGAVDAPALQRDSLTADQVGVPPGGGMLARTLPAPGVLGSGLYLVVDSGAKYPVAGSAAAQALGYPPAAAAAVPAGLLALLPTGPVLRLLTGGGA